MTNQVQENAASAVEQLQERAGGKLDYSPASLAIVEEILAEASKQKLNSTSRDALVELLGCYILEVGQREHGGKYAYFEARKQPVLVVGEPDFHVARETRGRTSATH